MLTLSRFGVRRLALVGDPCQLPPALHGCFGGAERTAASTGLGRALFSRLESAGRDIVRLRRQYRCHPKLSDVRVVVVVLVLLLLLFLLLEALRK